MDQLCTRDCRRRAEGDVTRQQCSHLVLIFQLDIAASHQSLIRREMSARSVASVTWFTHLDYDLTSVPIIQYLVVADRIVPW